MRQKIEIKLLNDVIDISNEYCRMGYYETALIKLTELLTSDYFSLFEKAIVLANRSLVSYHLNEYDAAKSDLSIARKWGNEFLEDLFCEVEERQQEIMLNERQEFKPLKANTQVYA